MESSTLNAPHADLTPVLRRLEQLPRPRICPGRYLALLEMKMAIAVLLGNFEIENVATPDGKEAREQLAFTMQPVGLRMRLRQRERLHSALPELSFK